ncbi:hypothetical protein AB0I28_04880 [Phytomonospora sp. NPDC050363]|uniref:hypothetical protein n=1 Tax=Phytomonospora sp. NPDC050363 TaxID=3155642 RepID=UPI0033FF19BE
MDRAEARRLLARHAEARAVLLERISAQAAADGRSLWQVGSFAKGGADDWSDLDLVVTGGPCLLGEAVLVRDDPSNGPVGGGYLAAVHLTGPLLVGVDWYTWPGESPLPAEAGLLVGEDGRRGELPLSEALDGLGRGARPDDGDPGVVALLMIPIVAKYLARGDREVAAYLAGMLGGGLGEGLGGGRGGDGGVDLVGELREILRATAGPGRLIERIGLVLDVAVALRG